MRMSKSTKKDVNLLRNWLQFNDELSKIDPTNEYEWEHFKDEWEDETDFKNFIENLKDEDGFNIEYYLNYYNRKISNIHMRIIFGYETLVDNVCDPKLDYLDFNEDIKKGLELLEEINVKKTNDE